MMARIPMIRTTRGFFPKPSWGEIVSQALGGAGTQIATGLEAEKEKKRVEEERNRQDEERGLQLELLLLDLGIREAAEPVPGARPTIPEGEEVTVPRRPVMGLLGGRPEVGAPEPVKMTGPAPLKEETEIPGITFRGREVAPARRIPRVFQAEIEKAKAEIGTEPLSQEMWEQLPEFYKSRWQPGQRVPSAALGTVGTQVFEMAKSRADAAGKAPQSRTRAGRTEEWDPTAKKWKDVGPSAAPEKPTFTWVTETDTGKRVRLNRQQLDAAPAGKYTDVEPKSEGKWVTEAATGNRVQVTPSELAAAPKGKYSDIRPMKTTITSGQMAQSREAALQVLGSSSDTKGDSMWALAKRLSVPKAIPIAIGGPLGKAAGVVGQLKRKVGAAPDIELYSSQLSGFIPLFARAVGHSGVLTEKDVERTELLFPQPGDTEEVATRKLNRIQSIMSGKEKVPPSLWEHREGHWPPGNVKQEGFTPTDEESQLLKEFGY
jgi:hypothetical protein